MKNKNIFRIVYIGSILFLCTLFYFGISTSVKGTSASGDCGDKHESEYDGVTYCCPNRSDTIKVYEGKYYCFNKNSAADDFEMGMCYKKVTLTSLENLSIFQSTVSEKTQLCETKVGSGWYYSFGAACGTDTNTPNQCTCLASASVCTTLATLPEKEYTLTFNANNGTVSKTTETCTTTESSCEINSTKWPIPSRSGYKFRGWSETSGCPNNLGKTTGSFTLNSDKTVYACWSDESENAVCWQCNSSDTIYYWGNSTSDYTGTASCNGGWHKLTDITKKEDCVLKYTIRFDTNGVSANVEPTSISVAKGAVYGELPKITPDDENKYKFLGWYTAPTSGIKIESTNKFQYSEDIKLYAHWDEIVEEKKTIEFNANNGTLSSNNNNTKFIYSCSTLTDDNKCKIDSIPSEVSNVFRKGYELRFWGIGINCENSISFPTSLNPGSTVVACWKGVSGNTCGKTVDDDYGKWDEVSCNTKVVSGWCHKWDSTNNCCSKTEGSCSATDPTTPTPAPNDKETQTTPNKKTFTATFDPNGGELEGSNTATCTGETKCPVSLPVSNNVGRDGYDFKGWGAGKSCTSGETGSVSLSENKTFYACWSKNNDGTPSEDGEPVTPPDGSEPEIPKVETIPDNPTTGDTTLIAFVWFFGLMAIGYAVCYFNEAVKK